MWKTLAGKYTLSALMINRLGLMHVCRWRISSTMWLLEEKPSKIQVKSMGAFWML
jgi:hypothetical protein